MHCTIIFVTAGAGHQIGESMAEKFTQPVNKRQLALKILGLLLGAFLIYWFVGNSDLNEIWGQLMKIRWRFLLLVAVMFTSFYVDTIGWRLCFPKQFRNLSLTDLFMIRLAGESLAQINPTNVIAGDTMKAVLLKRDGITYTTSIASLTLYRFITILAAATFVIAGVFIFIDYIGVLADTGVILGGIALFLALILYLFYRLQSGKGIFSLATGIISAVSGKGEKSGKRLEKLDEIDTELIEFFRNDKVSFFLAYILSVLHRFPEVIEYYMIFSFLNIEATFLSCVAVSVGVTLFKALGSFIPGQLGIEEYGNKVMLDFIKVSGSSTWLSVSILRRARQIVWIFLGVLAFIYLIKIKRTASERA